MSEKTSQRTRLMQKRAQALATVLLTSRDDLHMTDLSSEEMAITYLVTIHCARPGLRQFGVVLRAALVAGTVDQANKVLEDPLAKITSCGPFPYPVCLFFFTMMDSQAWYTWILKPVDALDGSFGLKMQETVSCQILDQSALDKIVTLVNRWYDASFSAANSNTAKTK